MVLNSMRLHVKLKHCDEHCITVEPLSELTMRRCRKAGETMALLRPGRSGFANSREDNEVYEALDWTYFIFNDDEGNKYLQIDSYGKDVDPTSGEASQSIQLDAEGAWFLKELIEKEFKSESSPQQKFFW